MKSVVELILHNPIFKIVGISLILYFALFQDKTDPQSLGNRLSKEEISKDLKEVKKKGYFIVDNLRKAQEKEGLESEEEKPENKLEKNSDLNQKKPNNLKK